MKAVIEDIKRLRGASKIAKNEGVTREHLWQVVSGRRQSRRLANILKTKYGITVKPMVAK